MSPATFRLMACGAAVAAVGAATPGIAAETPIVRSGLGATPIKFEVIDSSRLGCSQGLAMWTSGSLGAQCAFDTAARGASMVARQDWGKGSVEAYTAIAHAIDGANTPDQLLASPGNRSSEVTHFFLVGLKGSALEDRVKFTTEFASTRRIVDDLPVRSLQFVDGSSESGTSARIRVDAKLVNSPRFNWSMTAELRSVSDNYSVGRSEALSRYAAMHGTRLSLSSKARVGQLGVNAGLDRFSTPYGESASHKVGIDLHGVSLRLVSRNSQAAPAEVSTLIDSSTRMTSAYIDLDSNMLAMSLLPEIGELPFLVPSTINFSYRSGETENHYTTFDERFGRSSLGIDGTWETPIGETILSYWRDSRTGITAGSQSRSNETMQVSHFVRRGNWRFGLDAALTRGAGDGSRGYGERSWSFGQSVSYTRPDGPEFRLSMGQDRDRLWTSDASFASSDSYSQITASLDLSSYLQKRFERSDLRLTLDYRKSLSRSDMEMSLFDEMVEHWVEGDRREGFLMSFGMKL